jgi:hypothetical protein
MRNDGLMRSGDMPPELMEKVDGLLDEFMAIVDSTTKDRHLQRGIVRSQLPCSVVAILDKESLFIAGQFRTENRFSTYIYTPEFSWPIQKVNSSAQWEFGFEDPFVIQIPARLLDKDSHQRHDELLKLASEHIDSEFARFIGLLSLLRTRPIFGPAPPAIESNLVFLLMSQDEGALEENGMNLEVAKDIRDGRSAVREMWISLNQARVIIADLAGTDPGVMYGLGIAHTIGKETVLLSPQGSMYLVDIPRTKMIEYEDSDDGRAAMSQEISDILGSMMRQIEGA